MLETGLGLLACMTGLCMYTPCAAGTPVSSQQQGSPTSAML